MGDLVAHQQIAAQEPDAEQQRGQRRGAAQQAQPVVGVAAQPLRDRARGHGVECIIQPHAGGGQQVGRRLGQGTSGELFIQLRQQMPLAAAVLAGVEMLFE